MLILKPKGIAPNENNKIPFTNIIKFDCKVFEYNNIDWFKDINKVTSRSIPKIIKLKVDQSQ